MVGMMAVAAKPSADRASDLLASTMFAAETPAKLKHLRLLSDLLLRNDALSPSLLPDFTPRLLELRYDPSGPVRKVLAELICKIGSRHVELIPGMVPILVSYLKDDTPAVARQTILTGTILFRRILIKVAVEGLLSRELDNSLESSWTEMIKLKDEVSAIAFQPGSDGVRSLAIKFLEMIILLYTPDPNGPSQPASLEVRDELVDFDISWLRGGHPLLNVSQLAVEASQSLRSLLDQLRIPSLKSLSISLIIVLINSLSAIAKRRPAFYGRILPVLLGLDPPRTIIKGVQVPGADNALKNAFVSCLQCTHPGAVPWRDRLVDAIKAMDSGELIKRTDQLADQVSESSPQHSTEADLKKDGNFVAQMSGDNESGLGRKRSTFQDTADAVQDDDIREKRLKHEPLDEPTGELPGENVAPVLSSPSSTGPIAPTRDGDMGSVQHLVALFGALVAQGEKAAASLEIIISSLSSDVLAEVVMANLRFLPPTCPKAEEEDLVSKSNLAGLPSTLIADIFSLLNPQPAASQDTSKLDEQSEPPRVVVDDMEIPIANSSSIVHHLEDRQSDDLPSANDVDTLDSEIPGLDSSLHLHESQDTIDGSQSSTLDTQGTYQDQVATSVDRSEANSPKESAVESSTVPLSCQVLLPKMSVPVVCLNDEETQNLQKLTFMHVVDAYKQIAAAGGSHIRFSLLACLGAEYPLELDSWSMLQEHILEDYVNHEGHELTLRVLYRLYRDAEHNHDFFSSTTATSSYEAFLLAVAKTLRDSFPASDKSLSRLLGEVPYLPKSVFKLLECLCSPGSSESGAKESLSGDRVTQGLSAVWSLIMLRPPIRDVCLKIALQSAVHHLDEVRMKAIRLVANKLYAMHCISQSIEDYASEMLLSVVKSSSNIEGMDSEKTTNDSGQDLGLERLSSGGQSSSTQVVSSSPSSEAQRCMSLYFALCTKKHSLLRQIFVLYKSIPQPVKQAVHRHIPILIRTVASSTELLAIISDPPDGSEDLLILVLHTLTDGIVPSRELISAVRTLYDSKKDGEILIPILPYLSKDEVLPIFPQLVNLSIEKFQAAIGRLLQGSPRNGPSLTPAEVLITIHGIDPEREGIALKKVIDACSACFEQRQVFTQQVFAKALNQLVEQIPLPLLFMRTVIQAIGVFPALVDFIMEILSRLVSKQIWKYPKLWVGFLKCTVQTKPQSFSVLLQLPALQLENALNKNPTLKPSLVAYADQPNIRSSLPRPTLVALGLAQENQGQGQTAQSQNVEPTNSAETAAEEYSS